MSMAYATQVKAIKQLDSSQKIRQAAFQESLATYNELNNSLETKVKTSHRIIEKLDKRAKSLDNSILSMKQSHAHLLQALRAKDQPLTLCTWRREQREKRPLREHVRDHVELALEEEKVALIDTQRKLRDAIKMSVSMIALLEGKRDELQHDLELKSQALTVDETCLQATARSKWHSQLEAVVHSPSSASSSPTPRSSRAPSEGHLPLSARLHRYSACPHTEESHKNEALRQDMARRLNHSAHSREEAAHELMADNKKLTERCEKVVAEVAAKTEKSLQDRINEIQQMRRRLELEAKETKKKEEHTRATISETRSQMQMLEEPIALCSTHSSWRKQRAQREQIRDPVENRLEKQKQQLTKTAEVLRRSREAEKGVLTELQEHMERLQEDLRDKTAALNIDMNCLTHSDVVSSPFCDPATRLNHVKLAVALKKQSALTPTRPRSRA